MKHAQRILALALVLACVPARAEDPFPDGEKTFKRARDIVQQQYVDDKLTDDKQWQNATQGLLVGLADGNRWNKLLSPTELAAVKADLSGEIVGIGVEIDFDPVSGMVVIEGVLAGSAAEKAGMRIGDRILRIDERSLKGLDINGVAKLIRGQRGTPVKIAWLRDAQLVTKTITRQTVTFAPASLVALPGPGNIAIVEIRGFNEKTPKLLAAALQKAKADGIKGIVVDVRDNMGGMFTEMIDCAGMFLPKGTLVVTSVGRGGKTDEQRTTTEPIIPRLPMAVLINGDSASGAEILAAALKASGGARLVGTKTYGKWSVQRIDELGNGWAIKLTTHLLRSPTGEMLNGKGLEPDLQVDMKEHVSRERDGEKRVAADAQLRAAVHLLQLTR